MKEIIQREIVKATCDICGEDCMKDLFSPSEFDGDDSDKEFEGMELKAIWGFASKKDGEVWDAIICENCVDKHLVPLVNFMKTPYL
jgi:hypothetical protein